MDKMFTTVKRIVRSLCSIKICVNYREYNRNIIHALSLPDLVIRALNEPNDNLKNNKTFISFVGGEIIDFDDFVEMLDTIHISVRREFMSKIKKVREDVLAGDKLGLNVNIYSILKVNNKISRFKSAN